MNRAKRFIPIVVLFALYLAVADVYIAGAQETNRESEEIVKAQEQEGKGLSLLECIQHAAKHSSEVKLARLDYLIAETDRGLAESIFDTTLSLDASYEQDRSQQLSVFGAQETLTNSYSAELEKTLPTGTELSVGFSDARISSDSGFVSSSPSHEAQASATLRQPLAKNVFGYVDRRSISITSLAIKNADLDSKERIEAFFTAVESLYWQWSSSKRALEIYSNILEKAVDLHEANSRNYDTGIIEKGDFLASQANVISRERDVLLSENRLRRDEDNLKLLMNMDSQARIYCKEGLEYRQREFDLNDCLELAFKGRRDYQKAKREVEIDKLTLQTKANERWPEIDLVASLIANGIDSHLSDAAEVITEEDNTYYYTGVEVTLPLENNAAKAEFEKAELEKEKALLGLKQTERTIVTEISNAFRDYKTYEANVDKLIEVVGLQKEKLEEEEKKFNYGRSRTKLMIDYQQDYLRAELALGIGLFELETARVDLEKALNIILEKYEGAL